LTIVQYGWHAARDGTITWVDPIRERVLGVGIPPPFQAGWLDMVHPDDRGRVAQVYRTAIRGGMAAAYSGRLMTATGVLLAHIAIIPRDDDDGHCVGFIGRTRLEMIGQTDDIPRDLQEVAQEEQVGG
jgi:PAS domain-containing protein